MIDHSNCDHPRSSGARAKCRRAQANGEEGKAPRKKMGATPREVNFGKAEDDSNYGQTPSRKEDECRVCGVERIAYRGTEPVSGMLLYVGDKCLWRIKNAEDLRPIESLR